jgi:hypothetical protein
VGIRRARARMVGQRKAPGPGRVTGISAAGMREATLREFVANDDIHVRRSILPGLSLSAAHYPGELHGLVASIARSRPDEYIRHRVEIQVNT